MYPTRCETSFAAGRSRKEALMAAADRPAVLGRELALKSEADVNAALHELGWLQQQSAAVDADTKQAIEQLKEQAARELTLDVDNEEVTFATRIDSLTTAIERFLQKNSAKLFSGDLQSKELSHGRIGWKRVADAVVFLHGRDEKAALKAITEKTNVARRCAKWLTEAWGKLTFAQFLRLKPELDKTALKEAWQRNPTLRPALRALGLKVETDRREWVIEPASIEVSAPSA
jgi:hypothetical protein